MLITVLFAVVFAVLLVKAIYETICGISMMIYALLMMLIVAPTLDLMAFLVRRFSNPQPKREKQSIGKVMALYSVKAK